MVRECVCVCVLMDVEMMMMLLLLPPSSTHTHPPTYPSVGGYRHTRLGRQVCS